MLTVLHTEEERGQVQTYFWKFMDVGFLWKNIKNVYLEKITFKDLQKKIITWFEKLGF